MMDPIFLGLIGLVVLFLLIMIRMPIAYAMILVGGLGITLINGPALVLNQLKTLAYFQFSIYSLTVVPMFVLMGCLASRSGLSAALFRAANAWLGWLKGGTAMAVIAACAGFGAVCGSSLATASTMGRVALPELKKYKYSGALATGSVAAGGVLGILIPPSVVLIIYAVVVEANIVSMFLASIIPGLMATLLFILTIAAYVIVVPESGPRGSKIERDEFIAATKGVFPVLLIFGLVLGGIFFGFYNPTPAAAIGVFLVLGHGLITSQLNWNGIIESIKETAGTSGMIYLILLGAELMKIFLSRVGLPQETAS
ncbi:MAG: TRAP transporter large permease subunit, partial [Rhodobacteraceae bacterium]|nr:TRAP transporter large permease subunit [Paracoccaceae bacterium]